MTQLLLKNRYQIVKTLAEGGFGQTYVAHDTDLPSSRLCVIKELKVIAQAPEIYRLAKERFQREAAILEKLGEGHGQIPTLFAYFEENGKFYVVQEFISGPTLTQKVIKDGPLNDVDVAQMLVDLLLILTFVHAQKIVHRDIKPDNIILRSEDERPVLIDFGAVKECVGTMLSPSGKSVSTVIVGTPGFMSSEQAIGRPNYSSDLYSLGLTAIFCLTGKIPQEIENDFDTDSLLWLPEWPIDPRLVQVINKAIESHPRDRFTNSQEMLAALQPVITHPISLPSLTNTSSLSKSSPLTEVDLTTNFSQMNTKLQPNSRLNMEEYHRLEQVLSQLIDPVAAALIMQNSASQASSWQQLIDNVMVYLKPNQLTELKNKLQKQPPKSVIVPETPEISQPMIDQAFIIDCERKLAQVIGPLAQIVVKKTLNKFPHLNHTQLIDALAEQTGNPQKSAEFKRLFN